MKPLRLIIFLCLLCSLGAAASEVPRLAQECRSLLSRRQWETLRAKSAELVRTAQAEGDDDMRAVGQAYDLRASVNLRDREIPVQQVEDLKARCQHMESLGDKADPHLLTVIASALSQYSHFVLTDFPQSSHYAFTALEAARRAKDQVAETGALSGLAAVYFHKNDASGLTYATQAYELAKRTGDKSSLYVTQCNMANYLFNQKKYAESLAYLNQANDLAEELGMDCEKVYILTMLGDINNGLGLHQKAEACYLESLKDWPQTTKYDVIYARICYAYFLGSQNRLPEAEKVLSQAQTLMQQTGVKAFASQIYGLLAGIYAGSGRWQDAYKAQGRLISVTDSLITEQKEREFAVLDLRYRLNEERDKTAQQALQNLRQQRTAIAVGAVALLLASLLLLSYFQHRRQKRQWSETAARAVDAANTERHLREQLQQSRLQAQPSKLSDQKAQELYGRMEQLMDRDHAYRDPSLSLDHAAEMLGTNRTYLSQVVNELSGKSFSTYVSDYRINEAIRLLSDPANEEPLKNVALTVGFASPNTFYSLFRQKVGVSPSVFRKAQASG